MFALETPTLLRYADGEVILTGWGLFYFCLVIAVGIFWGKD